MAKLWVHCSSTGKQAADADLHNANHSPFAFLLHHLSSQLTSCAEIIGEAVDPEAWCAGEWPLLTLSSAAVQGL